MTSNLQITRATLTEVPDLLELYQHLNPEDPQLELAHASAIFKDIERIPGSCVLLGRMDGEPVSSCTLMVMPNLTRGGRPYALIENVVTHQQHRGQGYGKTILQKAIELAWEENCYKVMLLTGSKDPATMRFYESCGFVANKTGFQIRNGVETNDRMGN